MMRRLITFWLVFLIVVAAFSSGFTRAQDITTEPEPTADTDPRIITGSDLGFRIEGMDREGNPTGTFVVRIKGKWFEASSALGVRPAK